MTDNINSVNRASTSVTSKHAGPRPSLRDRCRLGLGPTQAAVVKIANRACSVMLQPIRLIKQRGVQTTARLLFSVIRQEGLRSITRRLISLTNHKNDYLAWIKRYDSLSDTDREAIRSKMAVMPYRPKLSILVPVYNPQIEQLDAAIYSVRNQLYPDWELCIADDASTNDDVVALLNRHAAEDSRIKLIFRTENGHISNASNSALELVTGEFVALLDQDDLLPEQALFWIADAIIKHPHAGLIYSDEDKINLNGVRHSPYFKPDWNPNLLLSHNYVSHLGVYRTTLIRQLGGFRVGLEGAQDYDLALRCIEQLSPEEIVHIPRVLYHWRVHSTSTASSISAKPYAIQQGARALNEHLERCDISGSVQHAGHGYRTHYALPSPPPLVSLIIPTRNGLHLLRQCVDSILTKTTYPNYEILIIDNGSDEAAILSYFKTLELHATIRVIRDDQPFNFSALNNAAVRAARGSLIGLINNDIEVIAADWLTEMVSLALQPGVGAVGAKLLYANNTLQHAGVVVGLGGVAGHSHKGFPKEHPGYCLRTALVSNYSAVTAACLVIQKAIYDEVGGLNEAELKVAFNDVDFCLKVREAGYRNVWTPYAELYHHESATRGTEDTPEKKARFKQEVNYMQTRWGEALRVDPAYSPNLSIHHEDFSFAWPPRVTEI